MHLNYCQQPRCVCACCWVSEITVTQSQTMVMATDAVMMPAHVCCSVCAAVDNPTPNTWLTEQVGLKAGAVHVSSTCKLGLASPVTCLLAHSQSLACVHPCSMTDKPLLQLNIFLVQGHVSCAHLPPARLSQ